MDLTFYIYIRVTNIRENTKVHSYICGYSPHILTILAIGGYIKLSKRELSVPKRLRYDADFGSGRESAIQNEASAEHGSFGTLPALTGSVQKARLSEHNIGPAGGWVRPMLEM